jgi:hypothetical protein
MRVLLALVAVALFTACGSSGEDLPTDAPTTTSSPVQTDSGGDVVICHQISDGSTPTTPTPVPSCRPGTDPGPDFQPYFVPTESTPAPLPPGTTALSNYFEFHLTDDPGATTVISLALVVGESRPPIAATVPPGATAYFYTFVAGDWQRLQTADVVSDDAGPQAQGTFDSYPANLIVLAEQ